MDLACKKNEQLVKQQREAALSEDLALDLAVKNETRWKPPAELQVII